MCDCRATLEAGLLEGLKDDQPDATNHKATLQGYGLAVTKGMQLQQTAFMDIKYEYTVIVKSTKLPKVKTAKASMLFSHCPFCGEKVVRE